MKFFLVFTVVSLFFVQATLCLAASTPAVLSSVPDFPVRPDIGELIANSPFFKLPTGDYTPFETHSAKAGGSGNMPQDIKASDARVSGSPLCQYVQNIITGKKKDWRAKVEVLSWAGLIALSTRVSQTNKYAPSASTSQITRLDKLIGQPFPLKEGNVFSLEITSESVMTYHKTPDKLENVKKTAMVYQTACQVGATGPASVVQAGLKGSATALACTVTPQGGAAGRPTSYHWLDSVGCFVRIPKP